MLKTNFKYFMFFAWLLSASLYASEPTETEKLDQANRTLKMLTAKILYNAQRDVRVYQRNQSWCKKDIRYTVGLLSFFLPATYVYADSMAGILPLGFTIALFGALAHEIQYLENAKKYEKNVIHQCAINCRRELLKALDNDADMKKEMRVDDPFLARILDYQKDQGKTLLSTIGALSQESGRYNVVFAQTMGMLLADEIGFLDACNA